MSEAAEQARAEGFAPVSHSVSFASETETESFAFRESEV